MDPDILRKMSIIVCVDFAALGIGTCVTSTKARAQLFYGLEKVL